MQITGQRNTFEIGRPRTNTVREWNNTVRSRSATAEVALAPHRYYAATVTDRDRY